MLWPVHILTTQKQNINLAVAAKVYIQLIINKATYAVRV